MLLTALLVGFACLPWCSSYRYYIIDEFKNWTEARDYCRKYYYDLATFDNKVEHDQVVQTLRSKGNNDSVWIGMYDDRYSWRWSNREKKLTYINWAVNEPDSYQSKEACAIFTARGDWFDEPCENPHFFLCYNATTNTTYLIQEMKSWRDALNYCRQNHTDLARIENQDENTDLKLLLNISYVEEAYMGLYRDTWKWSDRSSSKFRAWMPNEPNNFNGTEFCATLYALKAQWNDMSCSSKVRFVCGTAKKIQIVKINMQSPLNLNVSDFNSTILQQLQQKLGLPRDTKLTWRTQPDGQIFHTLKQTNMTNMTSNKQCKTVN